MAQLDVDRRVDETLRRLGGALRSARLTLPTRQSDVAEDVGISRSAYSRMERGLADGAPIADWIAAATALDLMPRFEFGRDPRHGTVDAGHLAIQELILRVSRPAGYTGGFELRTGTDRGGGSIDVCLRDPVGRRLVISECWNVIGDVGAGKRSFDRKLEAARDMAGWLDGGGYEVGGVWVVRATRTNRQLVARYPEVFAAAFPGSSRAWIAALTTDRPLPREPGLVWASVDATQLLEWRRPASLRGS